MTLARSVSLALLLGAGLVLAGPAAAQDTPVEKRSISELRDTPGGLAEEEAPKARAALKTFAAKYAAIIGNVNAYKASREFTASGITHDFASDAFSDLNASLLLTVQSGQFASKAERKHAVYLREVGAALDEALRDQIEKGKEPIVKVNAARALAHVCRAGSPAHYGTLTELIGSEKTRPEIKFHLLQAAGHLLAAPDLESLKSRNHPAQTNKPDLVFGLVRALERCVTDPTLALPGLPKGGAAQMTEDQADVVAVVRRQAIKALGRARYAAFRDSNDALTYPAHTLARVALSDPALVPPPGPADAAEAAIGLMNMSPAVARGDKREPIGYNGAAASEAVTAALIALASKRADTDADRLLPWRGYAARLGEALYNWRFLFDIGYDPGGAVKFDPSAVPAPVESLRKEVPPRTLAPLDKGLKEVGLEDLKARLKALQADPARKPALFEGVPATSIDFPPPK